MKDRAIVRPGATGATAPFNFGQRVHAPINFQGCYFAHIFFLLFPANVQILHPPIEISNKGTEIAEEPSFSKTRRKHPTFDVFVKF